MADNITITVNDQDFRAKLNTFGQRISTRPLLQIAGAVMLSSIDRTFREGGSPAGSWPALSPLTLKRERSKGLRLILIKSGRLKNSITTAYSKDTVRIGTNLVYARIQQEGGHAGRSKPGDGTRKLEGPLLKGRSTVGRKRKRVFGPFRRPFIPARPYLVFRPEDPQRITEAMQAFIDQQAQKSGLK